MHPMKEHVENERLNSVTIRPALKTDLPSIEQILRATIQNPYGSGNVDEEEVREELEKIGKTFISSEKGEVLLAENEHTLGFAFIGKPEQKLLDYTKSDPDSTLELRLLYFNPNQRNRGAGSQLLSAVEQRAKDMNMNRLELTSGPRYINIGADIFYGKRGFKSLGIIPNYFNDKFPAKVFQKDLH
jgi:GNAT superfamily N-acetyltransferase